MPTKIPQFEREDGDEEGNGRVTYFDKDGVPYENGGRRSSGPVIRFDEDEPIDGDNGRCGYGSFSPEWLQVFASKKAFMAVFSLLAVIQGMSWAYFTATITTLEKRFKISSQTAGIVMTGNELSQIMFSILLSYYGGRGHRPRWIAVGVLFSAMSCFVLASPHIFYGPGSDALSLTEEYGHLYDDTMSAPMGYSTTANPLGLTQNATGRGPNRNKVQVCRRGGVEGSTLLTDCDASDTSIAPLILIFISQFVSGIGVLLFFSLGGPYLDDNIEKTKSPLMFGITMSLRLVGPTLGFLFAGVCLKMYISPTLTPIILGDDPRWLGAWWLGWVVLGTLMGVTSFTIALFPRELPRAVLRKKLTQSLNVKGSQVSLARIDSAQVVYTAEKANVNPVPKLSEMPKAVKALLSNKVNLYNNLASIFYLFSAIGYWTFMPKYLQTIFMQTAVNASIISGVISIAFQSVGLLVSGYLISKYQPSARWLAGWNVFLGFLYVIVKGSFTQMGCNPGTVSFGHLSPETGTWNLTTSCNMDCSCKVNKIQTVCHMETNTVYYSACHAGCTSYDNGTISGCSCIPNYPDAGVTLGTCNEGCFTTFMIFLAVNAGIKLLDSSGRIGNMLVSYRCVDPKDKSLSIGLSIFLISVFAMLPAPIVFGKIFDSVCLVWGTRCGGRGNCWLYEGQTLPYIFNLTAAAFTTLGAFFDCLVWYHVKDLDLYDEDKNIATRKENLRQSQKGLTVPQK